ncbi:MAG: flagellar hook-associated protein FlgK [Actinobacteria bacterium]|nr:flagellar hook-associated protein FlgK [Actinomycetota bacterium]
MSSFAGLNTAITGLHAHKRTTEVIGHNVTNANTEGFSRRQVVLEPSVGLRAGSRHDTRFSWSNLGVNIATINRVRDSFADSKARSASASAQEAARAHEVLATVETVFPEPSDTALNAQLSNFWNAFSEAANQPASNPQRTAVLSQAETLTSTIRQSASTLQTAHDNYSYELTAVIAEVNSLAEQIAALNGQIRQSAISGMNSADMADQRDLLIDRLSGLCGATARPGQYDQVDVVLGGSTLVSGALYETLNVVSGGPLDPPLDTLDVRRQEVRWSRDGYPASAISGQAGGLMQGLNDIVPRYMKDLDDMTGALMTTVNAVHMAGEDQTGTTGLSFFGLAGTGTASKNIAVHADVAGRPERIALAAVGAGALDGSNGYALAAVASSATGINPKYQSMLGRLGVESQAAANRSETQDRFATETEAQRSSIIGVNIDEEITNLMISQRAYEASARLLTAVDEMLDVLINRTGLVGR